MIAINVNSINSVLTGVLSFYTLNLSYDLIEE